MKKRVLFLISLMVISFVVMLILCSCDGDGSHVHTPVAQEAVEATCTSSGKSAGSYCSSCGEVLVKQVEIPQLEHEPQEDAKVEPTCTEDGKSVGFHCGICGAVLMEQAVLSKTGHDFTIATCTEPSKCNNCGELDGEALGHSMKKTEAKAATCTENGNTAGESCSVCGYASQSYEVIPATGHTKVISAAVLPSDGNAGLTEGVVCSVCNKTLVLAVDPEEYTVRYGYEALGKLEKGAAMQELYDRLMVASIRFHLDKSKDIALLGGNNYGDAGYIDTQDLGLTISETENVRNVFFRENKQLFYWMSQYYNYSYTGNIVTRLYIFVSEEYLKGGVRKELDLKLYETVQGFSSDADNLYDRLLDYHDTLIENMVYARDSEGKPSDERWAHNVIGYVLYGKGVCESYTEMFGIVLTYNDIPCIHVTGNVIQNNETIRHSWNLVQMDDGKWYWFDLTYDDPEGGKLRHNFFCVADEQPVYGNECFLEYESRTPETHKSTIFQFELPERAEGYYLASERDAGEILKGAYSLDKGEMLGGGAYIVAGKIIKIDTPYSSEYKNITVTIEADGYENMPIICYRLAGDGADKLSVGDSIAVTGRIKNHQGSIEFEQGCSFIEYTAEADGHVPIDVPGYAPTCTEDGRETGSKCLICGKTIAEGRIIPKLSHSVEKIDARLPTCTEDGNTAGEKCTRCGLVLSGYGVIAATGHVEVITDAVLPVDGKGGLTEGIVCSVCDEVIVSAVDPTVYLTRTGYNYLGTLKNGKAMQELYNRLWSLAIEAHMDKTLNYESTAIEINIDDLKLTDGEAMLATYTAYIENKSLCYWMYGAAGNSKSVYIPFREEYRDGEVRYKYNLKLYRAIQSISSDADNAFDKTKDYHDYICNNIKYARNENGSPLNTNWAHNALGYVIYGEAVCEGYSAMLSLVLNYNGVPCINVHGTAGGGGHAWNLAQMDDGNWYWFDMTWNDIDSPTESRVDHSYFCVNDTQKVFGDSTFVTNHTAAMYMYELPARSEAVYKLTAAQILELAYELPANYDLFCGEKFTLTGKIIKVNTAYSNQYGNVTVTIEIEGCEDKPIQCYRLSGDGADRIGVGDIITVTGSIKNYNGTVEFEQGCVIESYQKP